MVSLGTHGSADTKEKYVIWFWGQPSLGKKEQTGGEIPYTIMSLTQLTEISMELKYTTTIFFTANQGCVYLT